MKKKLYMTILAGIDSLLIAAAAHLALWLRFDGQADAAYRLLTARHLPVMMIAIVAVGVVFRLYQRLWRYAGGGELVGIGVALTCFTGIIFFYDVGLLGTRLPYSMYVLYGILGVVFIGASRLALRWIRRYKRSDARPKSRVLIVGAGDAGAMIAREIRNSYINEKELIGFIDDDPYKTHQNLFGVDVLGPSAALPELAAQRKADEIIIAMPSAPGRVVREIARRGKATGCKLKIVPGLYELIDGKTALHQIRDIAIEDLLRRDEVRLDAQKISGCLAGRVVLVTGAGGSIGSELCRQIAKSGVKQLLLLGRGENSIYQIHQELGSRYPRQVCIPLIADVRDKKRLEHIFAAYRPAVVFHAAAHKHVPLMEAQPEEAIKNNIFGTKNLAECADEYGSDRFILISTDKAVNPTSVMGTTKRVAELILQDLESRSRTKYAAVRFGNVLGSRGSVVPLFKRQIAAGGPVTVTHPEMTRYFMTIPEAAQLVLQAGAQAEGGEVFLLDMGEPVNIMDMAKDLIELHGLELGKDIQIAVTGLRPGEKLYEELLTAEEGTKSTKHEKIFTAKITPLDRRQLQSGLQALKTAAGTEILRVLRQLVPTYTSEQLSADEESRGIAAGAGVTKVS